jgi:hypothetical protein
MTTLTGAGKGKPAVGAARPDDLTLASPRLEWPKWLTPMIYPGPGLWERIKTKIRGVFR